MRTLVAVVVGYALGAKSKGQDLDELARSLKALVATDEFADVVVAARFQVGSHLRALAEVIDGQPGGSETGEDLVAKVTRLVGPR